MPCRHLTSPSHAATAKPSGRMARLSSCFSLCRSAPCVRKLNMCPAWSGPWIFLLWLTCHMLGTGWGFSILIELTCGNDERSFMYLMCFECFIFPGRPFLEIWLIGRIWLIFPRWDISGAAQRFVDCLARLGIACAEARGCVRACVR